MLQHKMMEYKGKKREETTGKNVIVQGRQRTMNKMAIVSPSLSVITLNID